MLPCTPCRLSGNTDADEAIGREADGCILADAMSEENTQLRVKEAQGVDYPRGDEVVPEAILVEGDAEEIPT